MDTEREKVNVVKVSSIYHYDKFIDRNELSMCGFKRPKRACQEMELK